MARSVFLALLIALTPMVGFGNECRGGFVSEGSLQRLIQTLLEKRILTSEDLERMISSPSKVNPFALKDSTPANVNYRMAFERELAKVTDWLGFRELVKKKREEKQQEDRREGNNRAATEQLFSPKLAGQARIDSRLGPNSLPIFFKGRHLIITHNERAWLRIDMTDPHNPSIDSEPLGRFQDMKPGRGEAVQIADNRLYHFALDFTGKLKITDWTDPKNPLSQMFQVPVARSETFKVFWREGSFHFFGSASGGTAHISYRPGEAKPDVIKTDFVTGDAVKIDPLAVESGFLTLERSGSVGRLVKWGIDSSYETAEFALPKEKFIALALRKTQSENVIIGVTAEGVGYRWPIQNGQVGLAERSELISDSIGFHAPVMVEDSERAALLLSNRNKIYLLDWTEGASPSVAVLESPEPLQSLPSAIRVGTQYFVVSTTEYKGARVWSVVQGTQSSALSFGFNFDGLPQHSQIPMAWPAMYKESSEGPVYFTGSTLMETQMLFQVFGKEAAP